MIADSFVAWQVRRATRNLLRVNGAIVVGALLLIASTWTYWRNVWEGPCPLAGSRLVALTADDVQHLTRYYVTVEGRQVDAAIDEMKGSEVDWRWLLIEIDGRLLAVKSLPDAPSGPPYSGVLSEIPSSVRTDILPRFYARNPSLEARMLPFYLSADAFEPNGRAVTWGLAAIVLIALWNVRNALVRWRSVERHPSVRALCRHGDGAAASLEAEVAAAIAQAPDPTLVDNPPLSERRFIVTESWLFTRETFGFTVWHLDELLWVYETSSDRAIIGSIPSTLLLHGRDGRYALHTGTFAEVTETLDELRCRAPWVFTQLDERVAGLWKRDRAALIAEVDQRRQGGG